MDSSMYCRMSLFVNSVAIDFSAIFLSTEYLNCLTAILRIRNQHMKGIQLVAKISNGTVEGCEVGSREITFYPGLTMGGRTLEADSETAG